jgi:hypothetical protein
MCPLIWLRDCLLNDNLRLAIFSAALSAALGMLVVIWFEWMKRPKLRITIAEPWDGNLANSIVRTVRISVENVSPLAVVRWFIARQPAFAAYALIDFFRLDGTAAFASSMTARWVGSPQPPQLAHNNVIYPDALEILRYRDVHLNRVESMDLATKFDNDTDCFGFTNTSYFHPDFKDPDWRLPQERYRIRVSLYSGSNSTGKTFILRNDLPRPDFCLQNDA